MTDQVRVVIADDEPDLRLLLRLQLKRTPGIEVVGEAADGAEAVIMTIESGAHVVIMDLLMPGTNGFEAIGQLKSQRPEVGIVAYTAVAGDFVRAEMQRMDVELVLKSGDPAPLVSAIMRVASRSGAS